MEPIMFPSHRLWVKRTLATALQKSSNEYVLVCGNPSSIRETPVLAKNMYYCSEPTPDLISSPSLPLIWVKYSSSPLDDTEEMAWKMCTKPLFQTCSPDDKWYELWVVCKSTVSTAHEQQLNVSPNRKGPWDVQLEDIRMKT